VQTCKALRRSQARNAESFARVIDALRADADAPKPSARQTQAEASDGMTASSELATASVAKTPLMAFLPINAAPPRKGHPNLARSGTKAAAASGIARRGGHFATEKPSIKAINLGCCKGTTAHATRFR